MTETIISEQDAATSPLRARVAVLAARVAALEQELRERDDVIAAMALTLRTCGVDVARASGAAASSRGVTIGTALSGPKWLAVDGRGRTQVLVEAGQGRVPDWVPALKGNRPEQNPEGGTTL